jgi:acetylornithine deacetylase/succinyl-diaminopimelate desuccinylase-like protein
MNFNETVIEHSETVWANSIIPTLTEYIRIPNVSKAYDAEWKANGYMDQAVELVGTWCRGRSIAGLQVTVEQLDGLTPLIVIDVPAFGLGEHLDPDDTILLYGHLDKQPEMTGWREGFGPWTPVIENDRLYGRGGADDGYAAFASLTAIEALQAAGGSHARLVVFIEASEESGSPDLPAYLEALAQRIGTPSLVICLDSGCLDDQRMWVTTSLRGLAGATLRVDVLTEGVHSGEASGVVPSSFRLLRQLLDRIEDSATGDILVPTCHAPIPADRRRQAADTAREFPEPIAHHFPMLPGVEPMSADHVEQLLNRTWRPTLSITGAGGLAPTNRAGNVLRPATSLKLSLRLPPTVDAATAFADVQAALLGNPPSGARVTLEDGEYADGWNAPSFADWLATALDQASTATFGEPIRTFGEGGSIPFMAMLGSRFPAAQFVVTGALGPGSNAHGPNEFLDLATARKLTASLAIVIDAHARR